MHSGAIGRGTSTGDETQTWLRAVVWAGTLSLVLSGVLQAVFPQKMGALPAGMRTPVLALELARSPSELEAMFGPAGSEQRAQWVAQSDRGNRIDYAFIPVYCFFLFACARAFAMARPIAARIAIGLSLLAGLADCAENGFLFGITAKLGGEYAGGVMGLTAATWLKWLALASCLALLSPSLRARGKWGTVAGWIALLALPLALAALAFRGVAAELMLLAITLAIIAMWIEALRTRRAALALMPVLVGLSLAGGATISACNDPKPAAPVAAPTASMVPAPGPAPTAAKDPTPSPADPAAKPASASTATATTAPAQTLTRAAVDALLQHWLDAQNQGDFAAYAALYSADFHGTRRTRELVKRFTRPSWLADRKRMFAKPMTVALKSNVIGIKNGFASADFLQTWSSGKYSDEGAKRIVIRAEADGARILSEDMLESRPLGAPSPITLGMFLLVDAGTHAFAVLDGPIDAEYDGAPTLGGAGEETVAVYRELKPAQRAKYTELEGLPVRLIADGKTCEAKLGHPAAYKLLIPPEGDDSLTTLQQAAAGKTPAQLAGAVRAMWELDTQPYVAAPITSDCRGAVLAVRASDKLPVALHDEPLQGAAAEPLLASFDAQPSGRAFAQVYADFLVESGSDAPHDPAQLGFKQYTESDHALHRFVRDAKPVLATLTWWYGGCEASTDAFAVSDLGGEPVWREPIRGLGAVLPLAVFDADGDGELEGVVEDTFRIKRYLVRLGAHSAVLTSVGIAFYRCGC